MPSNTKKIIRINKKKTKKIKIVKKVKQDNDINNYINDKFLINQCQTTTSKLLNLGMSIDSITKFVKSYQECYIKLDKLDCNISKHFTFELFYKKYCKSV